MLNNRGRNNRSIVYQVSSSPHAQSKIRPDLPKVL